MRAAVLTQPVNVQIQEMEQPRPAADEVLIQALRVGICGSDVSLYRGHRPAPYPHILGHELVGRIVAVGDSVTQLTAGQRVVVEPNYPCGACKFCRAGRGSICPNKKSMGVNVPGCFADYATAPAEFVWPIPDSMSDSDAATIEPLTVSLHGLLQSGASIGDTIAVVGCGVIGLLLVHVAACRGLKVLAHDQFEDKLKLACRLGAQRDCSHDVAALWETENVTTVFECAGVSSTVELALAAAPRGAKVVLMGLASSPASFEPLRMVRNGIRIEPSLIYDHPSDFARSISLVASGALQPSCIVSDTFQLDSIGRALDLAGTGQAGKVHAIV